MRIQICANKYSHKYETTSNQDEYLVIIDTAETPPYSMATSYPAVSAALYSVLTEWSEYSPFAWTLQTH